MIRSSRVSLKFSNKQKTILLDKLFQDYKLDLQYYLDLIMKKQIQVDRFLSSKDLPINIFKHSQWRQIIYKHASQIYRSCYEITKKQVYIKYKKIYKKAIHENKFKWFTNKKYRQLNINIHKRIKIDIKTISINIDSRLLTHDFISKQFNQFIGIKLPYFKQNKKRAIQINLPIKYHKHYNKYKDWNRKNSIRLLKNKNSYFIDFIFEKQFQRNSYQKTVGIDIGFNKILSDSDNNYCGKDFFNHINNKLKKKVKNSKNYKDILIYRNNKLNCTINNYINTKHISSIILQDIKNLKLNKKTKYNGLTNWTYSKIFYKLQSKSQQLGIDVVKVSPYYTSQKCSKCGTIDKNNRNGQLYQCSICGLLIDADYNASINILQRGVKYNPSYKENLKQ